MTSVLMLAAFVATIGFAALAKRGRSRRKMGKYIKGPLDLNIAGGTLASNTAVLGATPTVTERALVSSIVCEYSFAGFTGGDNIGPVSVGVAHSDYTLAEIEAVLELNTGWAEANKVGQEIAKRLVRRIGTFNVEAASAGETSVLNDGKAIKTKLNWIVNVGQGLNFWIYNNGSAAFATTDPNCHILGHANIWPR